MSITLSTLVIGVTIAAIFLIGINLFVAKNHKSVLMSFLQNWTGALFLFSGWVKAIDPLGTAYKMEQYFDEFQYTFEASWMSFIAPLFPLMSEYSIGFSVFMIVFEILLAIMLLIGYKPKLTAWLFFLLVVFFTVLTGFTFLTGYVGDGGSFFDFGSWGEYKKSNMKVTDCGCFGDFLKLEPKVSFFKDVFLLGPAIFFLLKHEYMHHYFTNRVRRGILGLATIGLLLYCFNGYVWNLPSVDFRPFKDGVDVAAVKEAEDEAASNVEITHWVIENASTGEVKELANADYMSQLKTYNKANGWKVTDQLKSEPAIKPTKISAFEITDFDGNDVSYEYLDNDQYHFMIVSHKMAYTSEQATRTIKDTIYGATDTVMTIDLETKEEETRIVRAIEEVKDVEQTYYKHNWKVAFMEDYTSIIKPLAEQATKAGFGVSIVSGGADKEVMQDFLQQSGINASIYTADDILLKTIIRSNPGIVLWKDGKIVKKWHKSKLPDFQVIKSTYMK